ncbi:MAG: TFIIH/NER complex subunit [Trizodia sp. TS-e1964]|nr:MAG: TFIIH/NER complex subunit [Trizodia sp. TS-e1964]
MSNIPQRNGAPARRTGEDDDICPVCKSSRYLNPNMRFLINPECYHKMCESCVDRIFSSGPAPCPVAGCHRTLRKQRFRRQTFEDIQVEREVDIRRKLGQVFNRREDEFTTLLDYNNYLEEVETLAFNLLHNIDLTETENKLAAYAAANSSSIERNTSLAEYEHASIEAQQAAAKEELLARRLAAQQEEEAERREREAGRRELLEKLATGHGDATQIAAQAQKVVLKRSSMRKAAAAAAVPARTDAPATTSLFIKGLKPLTIEEPARPYDPFGGMSDSRTYYTLQASYEHPWLEEARSSQAITAGGYDVREYYARTMFEAFAGLGCDIEVEVQARDAAAEEAGGPSMAGAATGVVSRPKKNIGVDSDDVF